MYKKLFLITFLFIIISSISSVQASDVNHDIQSFNNETTIQIENQTNNNELNQTTLSSLKTSIGYKSSYNVVLKDSNSSKVISNKTVNFIINNINYQSITDINGVASINLDLNCGNYLVNTYFEGDCEYQYCNLADTIEIKSPIKANDITKYYKESTPFSAQFFDSNGNYLTNNVVAITVNGKTYSLKTNNLGIVSLAINLKPGHYKIVSKDPLTGFQLTTNFIILSTIVPTNLKKFEGEKLKVKFFKSNGKALAKKYVKIKFKGKKHKIKTNSKGLAILSLKKVKKGTYKVVCYNKDGLSQSFKLKVYKRKASTSLSTNSYRFLPGTNRIIQAKLSTPLGKGFNSGKTLKFIINGHSYSRKTDANGIAYLDLSSFKKGIYNFQVKYSGSINFKSSKTSNSFTIYDTTQTAFSVISTKHFGYGAGTLFKLAYSAGGVPLAGYDVSLTIDGKNYIKTTDNSGIVSIPINLKIGSYTVSYMANGDSVFTRASGVCNIDVFQRSSSNIIWKSGNSFKDNSQTFKFLVTNSKGEAVSGGEIELTIDGETYTSNVGANGYAKFKSEVAIGKYNVHINFKGNNNYLSSSESKSVNVKLSKFGNGLNEKNAKSSSSFLKSSSHCKVGAKSIKKLVKSLTKGLTSDVDKAKAIYNYVRDTLKYSYYYNSKYGATSTLKHKRGNCADHSHLLVCMFRTAGFHARYVHGKCHFRDGDVTGHVWTQVKIHNKWVCADAVSYRNSLGKIKNWNTKNHVIKGKYASLPF